MNEWKRTLRTMSTLSMLVACLSWSALTRAEDRKPSGTWDFSLRAETAVSYDDNILILSASEQAKLKDPAFANSDLFRIKTADDVIVAPGLALQFHHAPKGTPATNILLSLHDYEYTTNTVKTFQQYSFVFRQELHRNRAHSTALTLGTSYIPYYYLRQLIDNEASALAGTTIYGSATYSLNEDYIQISQELVDRTLSIAVRYSREKRNYNHHFDERDATSNVTSLEINVFPMRRIGFLIQPYFAHEQRTAQGQLASTTVVEDDPGFNSDLSGLTLRWLWGPDSDHRHIMKTWYERENRNFSSTDPTDTSHFGRQDTITQYGIDYTKELGPAWELRSAYHHRNNDLSIPSSLGGTNTTSFSKNVVTATLVYSFDTHNQRGRKRT